MSPKVHTPKISEFVHGRSVESGGIHGIHGIPQEKVGDCKVLGEGIAYSCCLPNHNTDVLRRAGERRLFALIIGINSYFDKTIVPLSGAVSDAKNFKKYLENDLAIPSKQIIMLTENQATRSAVIQSFKDLATDIRIKPGDAIVIYYAGHGVQVYTHAGHEVDGVNNKIEAIVPYDYGRVNDGDQIVQPIPDYTLEKLLSYIAQKKGDNIVSYYVFKFNHSSSNFFPDSHR